MQVLICEGETIRLGDGAVSISISRINGNQIRLGVEAPRDVAIHREEVYVRVKRDGTERSVRP
jgi:carbon storage regulator